ncbi:MAG: zinc-dependent peptidase, partial [bacterium]|nr:zinc-dependent peptidase [bacterium]
MLHQLVEKLLAGLGGGPLDDLANGVSGSLHPAGESMSKKKDRAKLRTRPFPGAWRHILEKTVPLYRRLPKADREELHGHVHVFLHEKRFEGCAGLPVTD